MQSGLIFDVKKYSINDGPGIRVTIFLKGCPLRCKWCHNPESISEKIQKMYHADKCIGCKACIEACPEEACTLSPKGVLTDRRRCTGCGKCAEVCPTKATEMSGKLVSVGEIVQIVEKEQIFFDKSDGGVTFSGGEPLMQPGFLITLLDEFGLQSVHRAVDTTGFVKSETLLDVARRTELFLYDLKLMDTERHKEWTGVDNARILYNLRILAESGAAINIRIPLVKGINDDAENLEKSATFIAGLAGEKKLVNILPYHNIAAHKYLKLGEKYDPSTMAEPGEEDKERVVDVFAAHGLKAIIGG